MSQHAIADAVGANQATISRDLSTDANASVGEDRKVLGQDGRERSYPQPETPRARTGASRYLVLRRTCDTLW